jgi:hypothetical protein
MALSVLTDLERRKDRFGADAARVKLQRLRQLARTRLRGVDQVERLHELLCFMRAYPDNAAVLQAVESLLNRFDRRADLRAHRDELVNSGIAGTPIRYPFFYPTACWLAQHWPNRLKLDRSDGVAGDSIASVLPALLTPIEAHAVREARLPGFVALDRLRGAETDATFLIGRIAAAPGNDWTREALYDLINPTCELLPGTDTPNRTRAAASGAPQAWRAAPLRRERPDLAVELLRPPRTVRRATRSQAHTLIELARAAMVTRRRDLDAFAYGNERDVWLIDDGDGLAFALIGIIAERRAVVSAIYGGLTLQNGVPVGYLQSDLTGRAAAISFNTFETFRGGEAAYTFARLLAALHHGFGSTSFSIEPYQLGKGNDEGLDSGAWWFYTKFGFRPRSPAGLKLALRELELRRRSPKYRTSRRTLQSLAEYHLFFDAESKDPAPLITPAAIGLAAGRHLTHLAGSDRIDGVGRAVGRAMAQCGLRSLRGASGDERRAWAAYAPVLSMLSLTDWQPAERRALVGLVRAKAAPSEREYVKAFAALPRLERALAALCNDASKRVG